MAETSDRRRHSPLPRGLSRAGRTAVVQYCGRSAARVAWWLSLNGDLTRLRGVTDRDAEVLADWLRAAGFTAPGSDAVQRGLGEEVPGLWHAAGVREVTLIPETQR